MEIINNSFSKSFYNKSNIGLATARAGNVIGGGDWGIGRLVPDVLKAVDNYTEVNLRYPNAFRPWQHVMEPLSGYSILAKKIFSDPEQFSEPFNFGPNEENVVSVKTLVNYLYEGFGLKNDWISLGADMPYEAVKLDLDSSKAQNKLSWAPKWSLTKTISSIVEWHKGYKAGSDMNLITKNQIHEFINSKGNRYRA